MKRRWRHAERRLKIRQQIQGAEGRGLVRGRDENRLQRPLLGFLC